MDFLESSLASPSVPSDPVAPLQLKRKRGPAASDRPEPALDEPLLQEGGISSAGEDAGRTLTLLDRLSRYATLCLWPKQASDELLVPPPAGDRPGVLSCLLTTLRRSVRTCCETVINGFIWSSEVRPF